MLIAGLQRLSLVDYPGQVACVIFTQGCNLKCPWCHNSDLIACKPKQRDHLIPEDEIFAFLEKRQSQLDGVVITGGEPTVQADLMEFLKKLRGISYKIKLDTNGTRPKIIQSIFREKLVDFIAMDIKAPLRKYGELTGTRWSHYEVIRESIDLISQSGIPHQFRTTDVTHLLNSDDLMDIKALSPNASQYVVNPYYPPKLSHRV